MTHWITKRELTSRLQHLRLDTHLLSKIITRIELFHETTTNIMLAMPFYLVRGLTVKDETDRILKSSQHTYLKVVLDY